LPRCVGIKSALTVLFFKSADFGQSFSLSITVALRLLKTLATIS